MVNPNSLLKTSLENKPCTFHKINLRGVTSPSSRPQCDLEMTNLRDLQPLMTISIPTQQPVHSFYSRATYLRMSSHSILSSRHMFERAWITCLKFANYSNLNNQHDWEKGEPPIYTPTYYNEKKNRPLHVCNLIF